MFNKKIICLLLIVFFLSITIVSAEDNQTDTLADDLQVDKNFSEIRASISSASAGDTIVFDGNYSDDDLFISEKTLNFEGKNNAKIDGMNTSSNIIYIGSSNVNIKDICFTNSGSTAMYVHNSNVTLTNCTFIGNNGGLQFNSYDNSTLTLSGCHFIDNKMSISIMGNNNEITNCEFTNNGMGISIYDNSRNLTVSDCIFKNNSQPIDVNCYDVFIRNSSFIDNVKCAVSIYGLNELIEDCKFINNGGGIYYGGHSRWMGVNFIYDGYERFIVRNSIFSNNIAYQGGAIYYGNVFDGVGNIPDNSKINVNEGLIENCTFEDNVATMDGAISYTTSYNTDFKVDYTHVTIKDSKFKHNVAKDFGAGSVHLIGEDNSIINCSFEDDFDSPYSLIDASGGNFTVDSCRFKNAQAVSGAAINYCGLKAKITNSIFENLTANLGGAIYAELSTGKDDYNYRGELIIENTTFANNRAYGGGADGGAISVKGSTTIDSCKFINNSAYSCSVLYSFLYKTTISNSIFINNTSPYGMIGLGKDYTLNNNTYENNSEGQILINYGKQGHKAFDLNLKSIDLIKVTIPSKIKAVYSAEVPVKVKLYHKYFKQYVKYGFLDVEFKDKSTGKVYGGILEDGVWLLDYTLPVGVHKLEVTFLGFTCAIPKSTITFEVTKIPTVVKAPKVTFKHKKSKYFKITVKANKKPLKKIVLKVKIGKKTYKIKTNSKGIAKFNTKKLKVGKYKVSITSTSKIYKISAKSQIRIKK